MISAAYTGGVLALACATSWVILFIERHHKTSEMAYVTFMMIWLIAVTLFVFNLLRV